MMRMTIANLIAVGAFACCAMAADAPPAQKAEPVPQSPTRGNQPGNVDRRPEQRRMGREWWRENGGPNSAARGWTGPSTQPMSDEEYERVSQFMQTNSPHRWGKLLELLPERRETILMGIRQQYQWMERLKLDDPPIYDIRLKRLPIEDEMFRLNWEARHGDGQTPADSRDKLREQVRLFLDNCLAERKLRLDRWRSRLREAQRNINFEESSVADLEANRESWIEKGMELIETDKIGRLKDWAGPMFNARQRDQLDGDDAPASGQSGNEK